jgi:hypothetical protein
MRTNGKGCGGDVEARREELTAAEVLGLGACARAAPVDAVESVAELTSINQLGNRDQTPANNCCQSLPHALGIR